MTYAIAGTLEYTGLTCSNCKDHLEPLAKFCGSCGFIVAPDSFNINEFPEYQSSLLDESPRPEAMPSFAMPVLEKQRSGEYNAEVSKIIVMLARERVFLYVQILAFLVVNIFGCWVGWKCYADFIGDEMSKMMMASTPFMFINSLALLIIVPIKGTRSEIARLKERLSHARFKIEFGHLNM